MGDSGMTEVRREHPCAERLTEGLTVAVALGLSFSLLVGPAVVFGTTAWHLITDTGTTAFSRFLVPVIFLALVACRSCWPERCSARAGTRARSD
ncbi:hypothetical protein EES42_30610 [Streptomyces sp. ADI95-17]|nr:hypothetical protein EES42_30610 [Streptomyces sp. ADI95-17]